MTAGNVVGWGATFLILITLADLPPTGKLAASFSWLILVSTIVAFGKPAMENISGVTSTLSGANVKLGVGASATGKPAVYPGGNIAVGVGAAST